MRQLAWFVATLLLLLATASSPANAQQAAGDIAADEQGNSVATPPVYEVQGNGDILFGGDALLANGCEQVASSPEDFPGLTGRQFQDLAAKCAELGFSATSGEQNVTALPDTGGLHLPLLLGGLVLVGGGLLLRRRIS